MAYRINHVNLLIGARNEGKTFYLLNEVLPKTTFGKVVIIDTFDHPSYNEFENLHPANFKQFATPGKYSKKTVHCFSNNMDDVFTKVQRYSNNMLIVFEDATKYLESNVPENVKNFVLDTKQRHVDLIFLFHSFKSVPPKLFTWADSITFFRTKEIIENQKNRVICYDEMIEPYKKLKASTEKYVKPVTILIN